MPWTGDSFFDSIRDRIGNGVTKAADTLSQRLTEKVSTPGPPRSKAGEAPHIDKNKLHGQMTFDPEDGEPDPEARAGTTRPYGVYLEKGTSRMAARPWALSTLLETKPEIVANVLSK